jgi:chromosome partitioning protein
MKITPALESDSPAVEEATLPLSATSPEPGKDRQPVHRANGPYVIAFSHQKGGVAKTTSAATLAAILAQEGQSVLAIDLDPTANLTASFGVNPHKLRRSAADILLGNETIANVSLHSRVPGLDLLPSGPDMATVARFLYLRPRFEHLLQINLTQLGPLPYDYIVIDCPPAISSLTSTALTAAQLAIIPIQCEYYSLQALDSMFKTIQQTREKTNPYLCFRMLVVMYDGRGSLHKKVLEMVQRRYGNALFEASIGFDSKLREAQLAGMPVSIFAPHSRATQQYQQLAQEILAYVHKQSTPQPA